MSSNINVFAFAFVCTFTFIVVALDIMLLRFLIFMSRFRRTGWIGPRIERWVQDGVLQLQRRAFEARSQGSWIHSDKEVPITVRRETLSDLDSDLQVCTTGGSDNAKGLSLGSIEMLHGSDSKGGI